MTLSALMLGSTLVFTGCTKDAGDDDTAPEESDTDTDTDTDTDADTAAVSYDGIYSGGTFDVDVELPAFGLTDTCSGYMEHLTVDEAAATQLDGALICSFSGGLTAFFKGKQHLDIDGSMSGSSASGNLLLGGLSFPWSGSFLDETTLEGSFSGTTSYYGYKVAYSGAFETTR